MRSISGKTVLVTGGTGSFGRYVVRRLLSEDIKEIRVFSRDEKKQFDMYHKFSCDPKLAFHLGDIRNFRSVREVMAGVDMVFQAAALKQVPNCERFPVEAIDTNVTGARNVIDAAMDARVGCVICIGTDKAVQPVNVMGMTKALQEKIVVSANESPRNRGTRFVGVRYGNVLNSRGSVVPFFRALIQKKLPLTITSVEMTRFLLTLNEAVELVLYAAENAAGGEIFVKRAESAQILDIARAVCDIAGVKLNYKVIGTYPGEKIHEILVSEEERTRCEERDEYVLIYPWKQTPSRKKAVSEYCSRDTLVSLAKVRAMIEAADREAEGVEFEEGFYTR
ncbi:MAG: SDR family NAD(P)-dependent oxidoreductase [Candidatus Eisenbacteria bacterium]|nr:SDR family NAD(P)-dependent oxidoreductase [Candidatus Eisenbacteria bacterium]